MSDRIYVVVSLNGPKRLIRAATKAQAINHCAKSTFSAEVASQDDLIELAGKTKVEVAAQQEVQSS